MNINPSNIKLTSPEYRQFSSLFNARLSKVNNCFKSELYYRLYIHKRNEKGEVLFGCILQAMKSNCVSGVWDKRCLGKPITIIGGWYEIHQSLRILCRLHRLGIGTFDLINALYSFSGKTIDLEMDEKFLDDYFKAHQKITEELDFNLLKHWKEPTLEEIKCIDMVIFKNGHPDIGDYCKNYNPETGEWYK